MLIEQRYKELPSKPHQSVKIARPVVSTFCTFWYTTTDRSHKSNTGKLDTKNAVASVGKSGVGEKI